MTGLSEKLKGRQERRVQLDKSPVFMEETVIFTQHSGVKPHSPLRSIHAEISFASFQA